MFIQSCAMVAYMLLSPHATTIYIDRIDINRHPVDPDLMIRKATHSGNPPIVATFAPMPKVMGQYVPCLYLASHKSTRFAKT